MKKQLLLLGTCLATSILSFAQNTPVSQSVEPKNAILEELTGIHCTYCPDGHKIAKGIADANPGRVVLVNIHAGSYAAPSTGEIDLRTTDGNTINSWMAPSGYPAGSVQRKAVNGVMPVSRGSWSGMVNTVLQQTSPVNIAMDATIDATTNELTVTVEMYYTDIQTAGTNHYLNVGILQDNIEGTQTGAQSYNPSAILPNGNYLHQHAFRGYINTGGTSGDMFDATQSGVITRTYIYTLPSKIGNVRVNLQDLKIFAFVGPGKNSATTSEILTAGEVTPVIENIPVATGHMEGITNSFNIGCNATGTIVPEVEIYNTGNEITSLTLTATINGGTPTIFNWTGSIPTFSSELITIDNIAEFVPASTYNSVVVAITEVNGGSGQIASTFSATKSISKAKVVTGYDFTVEIYTDAYPEETSWQIINSSNQVVASGGPYNANTDGQKTMTHNITLSETDCYSFKMYDTYGDGLAYGSNGAGGFGFKIKKGSQTLYSVITSNFIVPSGTSNSYYNLTEGVLDLTSTAGIDELLNTINMEVYPNPATEKVSVSFDASNSDYTISLIDVTGRTLTSSTYTSLNGQQKIDLPLAGISSGNYMISITSANGVVNKHIIVE